MNMHTVRESNSAVSFLASFTFDEAFCYAFLQIISDILLETMFVHAYSDLPSGNFCSFHMCSVIVLLNF